MVPSVGIAETVTVYALPEPVMVPAGRASGAGDGDVASSEPGDRLIERDGKLDRV